MEKLIKAYLIHIEHYITIVECEPVIISDIQTITRDGEQHYEITHDKGWLDGGVDKIEISVSELLIFLYERTL